MTTQHPTGTDDPPGHGVAPGTQVDAPEPHEPVVSLPNLLTLVRLPMAAAVWLGGRSQWWLIGLMIAAAVTDMLDGWFARRIRARREARGQPTRKLGGPQSVGAWLDPLCDKIFVVSLIGAVWVYFQPPWWLMGLIVFREILLVPIVFVHRVVLGIPGREHFDVRATAVGKLTTAFQFFALWAFLLDWGAEIGLALVAGVLGLFSALDYTTRAVKAATQSRSA